MAEHSGIPERASNPSPSTFIFFSYYVSIVNQKHNVFTNLSIQPILPPPKQSKYSSKAGLYILLQRRVARKSIGLFPYDCIFFTIDT